MLPPLVCCYTEWKNNKAAMKKNNKVGGKGLQVGSKANFKEFLDGEYDNV